MDRVEPSARGCELPLSGRPRGQPALGSRGHRHVSGQAGADRRRELPVIRKAAIMVLFGVLAGCGKAPDKPRGTGAAETAKDYLQSLVRKDWPSAYARVADASKSRLSQEQFARLAQEYRRRFGFEPEL